MKELYGAIADLEKRCDRLRKKGVSKGKPQSVRTGSKDHYYLVTSQGRGKKALWESISASDVSRLEAEHQRYKQLKKLKTWIKHMEKSLPSTAKSKPPKRFRPEIETVAPKPAIEIVEFKNNSKKEIA